MEKPKRRTFLKSSVTGTALCAAASRTLEGKNVKNTMTDKVNGYDYRVPILKNGATLLFQGDSITDMKWGRNQKDRNHYLGHSYVFLIASRLHMDLPESNLNFLNRGMSGHTVNDLQNRWQKDALDLNPDILSVLIGVNDVGKAIRSNKDVNPIAFEESYRDILSRSRDQNPNLQIVLLEPFVLPVTRDWRGQVDRIRPVVSKLASEFEAVFIPTQKIFDEAATRGGPEHWIWDGVHPLPQGHELIARNWIESVAASGALDAN